MYSKINLTSIYLSFYHLVFYIYAILLLACFHSMLFYINKLLIISLLAFAYL